ncbi:nitroreductase family protein [Mycobacterium branderi]|nr:nitroreductase family protein [Mycobacterium branderi]MCV7231873.1 nitroreductase family protein [Mycobacterium branderi]ORA40438.1 nitroreductase [Mycobacterium branderi]
MVLKLSTDELLTTTRSVRRRLDFERPVEREVVQECLRLAVQAPSGMNHQRWHWVLVTAPAKKAALADIYRQSFTAVYRPDVVGAMSKDQRRIYESARYLADNLARVPMMLIPCQWRRVDGATVREQAGFWGSLLPAVWSFMLALRSRGLGSCWTAVHLDQERAASSLLGIPYEKCTQAGLFPIAYTIGTDFKPAARGPLEDVVHWDAW